MSIYKYNFTTTLDSSFPIAIKENDTIIVKCRNRGIAEFMLKLLENAQKAEA